MKGRRTPGHEVKPYVGHCPGPHCSGDVVLPPLIRHPETGEPMHLACYPGPVPDDWKFPYDE